MRAFLIATVLLALVLVGLASSRISAQDQHPPIGIVAGEKLSLAFEAYGAGRSCTVIDVRNDFIGCQGESQGLNPGPEHWYNLRLIARIDRPGQR